MTIDRRTFLKAAAVSTLAPLAITEATTTPVSHVVSTGILELDKALDGGYHPGITLVTGMNRSLLLGDLWRARDHKGGYWVVKGNDLDYIVELIKQTTQPVVFMDSLLNFLPEQQGFRRYDHDYMEGLRKVSMKTKKCLVVSWDNHGLPFLKPGYEMFKTFANTVIEIRQDPKILFVHKNGVITSSVTLS